MRIITVQDLVGQGQSDPEAKGIAVAVNAEVMSREDWSTEILSEGDQVEIIQAVQGG